MNDAINRWNEFWFRPSPSSQLQAIRRGLCVVTAIYFAAALPDVDTWFVQGAPASSSNLATFFRTAELTSDARWMVSPLFVWDSVFAGSALGESGLVYRAYLVVGIILAVMVAFADRLSTQNMPGWASRLLQTSWPMVVLWVWLVGWANRVVLLAGITEPLLSVSLAALAIAPIGSVARKDGDHDSLQAMQSGTWRATLARRLLAAQATLIAIMTTASMLASTAWWNGTGAYALVAPQEDRLISVVGTVFERPVFFEMLTMLIVCTLPIGIVLAWRDGTRRLGVALVIAWCCLVGLLSANILHAATLGIIATSIGWGHGSHTPAGADGANSLNGGSVELTDSTT